MQAPVIGGSPELTSIQQILMILSVGGGLMATALSLIISNRMFKLKGDIMDKVEAKFDELKKDIKDSLVSKEFFNAKFDLLQEAIKTIRWNQQHTHRDNRFNNDKL